MSKKYGELISYDIIMEGAMKKSPPQKSKAFFSFITKKWRNRHFVLFKKNRGAQVFLFYFKLEPSPDCKNLGSIDLEKLTNLSVDVGCSVNRSNVFSVQTIDSKGNNRIYYLCTTSFSMMNLWVDKIVACLSLNHFNDSRDNNVLTLPSPANQIVPRRLPRMVPTHYISTPKLNSAIWSTSTSPERSRFSISNLLDHSNENTSSSYYNFSAGKSPMFQDNLEDSVMVEEEDIYRYPCELQNHHAYVNLNEDTQAPSTSKPKSMDAVFFSKNDKISHGKDGFKLADISSCQKHNFLINNIMMEYQNIPDSPHNINNYNENDLDNISYRTEFSLPTRIKNKSTSSNSSSSDSSSSTEELSDKHKANGGETKKAEEKPTTAPMWQNLNETVQSNAITETVLPVKTPKLKDQKHDSVELCSNINEDSLNYVDAKNLQLANHNLERSNLLSDSIYSSITTMPVSYLTMNAVLPTTSDLKCSDSNTGHDTPSRCSYDDFAQSSVFVASHVKDVLPMVEYREICDVRTEALLKLSVRILNNE